MKIRRKKAALSLATKDGEMTEEYMQTVFENIEEVLARSRELGEELEAHRERYPLPAIEGFDFDLPDFDMEALDLPSDEEHAEEMAKFSASVPTMAEICAEIDALLEGAKQ